MVGFKYTFKSKVGYKIEDVSGETKRMIEKIFSNLRDLNYEYYEQYQDEKNQTFNILIVKK